MEGEINTLLGITIKFLLHGAGGKRLIPTSNCPQQDSLSLIQSEINRVIVNFTYLPTSWLVVLAQGFSCVVSRQDSRCAQTEGLTGSQRADLSPLKINTFGCLPSGSCHSVHSTQDLTPPTPTPHPSRVYLCHSPDSWAPYGHGSWRYQGLLPWPLENIAAHPSHQEIVFTLWHERLQIISHTDPSVRVTDVNTVD